MKKLNDVLKEEIIEFRENGHKFLNKELNVAQFRGISGGMGVYAHRGGKEFAIRLKTPSGKVTKEDFNKIYEWASRYNLTWIHPTTRQSIQLHGLGIDDVCDLMEEAIDYGIYTRGSGGNFPRNVAMSPLSGVEKGEAFDVTPYAEEINKYIMERVYTYKLPRKIKIAMATNKKDEPHCTVTDLGFLAVNKDGEKLFKVYLGGGLGRNPRIAVEYDELIKGEDVLYHVEAMTNLFIAEGDYNNKNKARIRYIVERMGEEEFLKCYKKHLEEAISNKNLKIDVKEKEIKKEGIKTSRKHARLVEQKQDGLYSVYFHPVGGKLMIKDLRAILDATEKMDDVDFRLTMKEGMYIRNLNGNEAEEILDLTQNRGGELKVMQSVSCIGVPICQMGLRNSQELLTNILDKLSNENIEKDILPLIHISGCTNSCGVHEIGAIGFSGKSKRVNNELKSCFELQVDGDFEIDNSHIGEIYGDIVETEIPNFIYDLYKVLENKNIEFRNWYKENKEEFKNLVSKYLV
ncbi:ferredoxin-nitrite reductase [Clostridium moniliforme]|uniref:Ferredoxin-nitrite reductase n=1 Tax=Clostridium moniliforme TaxID=39489 RepID=A0ABS4F197_9CLOT|nr:nitrite/sulfite reductase [Clostridium moniliforme]MBP1890025.1 ferredoxin-nitrite reductase [Clostridium moniliforme]